MIRYLVRCIMTACFVVVATVASFAQQPIDRSVKLNGGLVGRVVKIGYSRSRSQIAATVTIENKGSKTAYLGCVHTMA